MFDLETAINYLTIAIAVGAALLAALWLSFVIWTFRDMRRRSRDPFAQILAALVVAVLPLFGLLIYLILRPPETLAEAYERALEEEALLQEIEERPSCPGCSRIVQPEWMVCPHCHAHLKKACVACDRPLDLQWTICPFCAAAQPLPAEQLPHDSAGEPLNGLEADEERDYAILPDEKEDNPLAAS